MQSISKPTDVLVAGLFYDRASVDKAVSELRTAEFADDAIEEFKLSEEQISIEKKFVILEDVNVSKRVITEIQ